MSVTASDESQRRDAERQAASADARAFRFQCVYRYHEGFLLDLQFQTNSRITALYGPSGSGKTTVLRLIAGLLRPAEGCISLGDQVLVDTRLGRFCPPEQRQVGMLFQEQCLFPHMTVHSNLMYGKRRRLAGVPLQRIVESFELDELLSRYPRRLSGGEQQRVALARAILSGPRLLLLDEPLTAIQPRLREQIIQMLQGVIEQLDLTTLVVSHDRSLVERMAGSVLTIDDGRIAGSGR